MQRANSSSLSLLDLLTCALGGMLLLFFIVVAVRRPTDTAGKTSTGQSFDQSDLVLISVRTLDESDLFETEGRHVQLYQDSSPLEIWPESVLVSEGRSFFTVLITGDLEGDIELRVHGMKPSDGVEGFCIDSFESTRLSWKDLARETLYAFERSGGSLERDRQQ